jgi:hypothetical protein
MPTVLFVPFERVDAPESKCSDQHADDQDERPTPVDRKPGVMLPAALVIDGERVGEEVVYGVFVGCRIPRIREYP